MAVIVIKDLPESIDLDSEAMTAILGGGRTSAGRGWHGLRQRDAARLATYPEGWPDKPVVTQQERPAGKLPRK